MTGSIGVMSREMCFDLKILKTFLLFFVRFNISKLSELRIVLYIDFMLIPILTALSTI